MADIIEATRQPGSGVDAARPGFGGQRRARTDRRAVRALQRRADAGAAARRHRRAQPRRAQRRAAHVGRSASSRPRCGRCWCR
ncbi:MAG: hypothetical protein MZW92_71240 [Comamonadaceae bacterium]|nr:hypothetical protein [Comamonadaceae bacterium]